MQLLGGALNSKQAGGNSGSDPNEADSEGGKKRPVEPSTCVEDLDELLDQAKKAKLESLTRLGSCMPLPEIWCVNMVYVAFMVCNNMFCGCIQISLRLGVVECASHFRKRML